MTQIANPTMVVEGSCVMSDEIQAFLDKEGWKTIHNGDPRINQTGRAEIEFLPILDTVGFGQVVPAETSIKALEMLHRAAILGADLNRADALWLLRNQDKISESLRDNYIVTGFLAEDRVGRLRVLYLDWNGGLWHWDFDCVEYVFYGDGRFARPK